MPGLSLEELIDRSGASPEMVHDLVGAGIVSPDVGGEFRPSAIAQVRLITGLVEAGASLDRIRTAVEEGRLSFQFVDLLMPDPVPLVPVPDETEAALRFEEAMEPILGSRRDAGAPIREDDLAILRIVSRAVDLGAPPDRILRIVRSMGQLARRLIELQRDFVDDVLLGPAIEATGSPIAALETTSEARYLYRELAKEAVVLLMGRQVDDAIFRNLVQLTEHALATGGVALPQPEDTIAFIDVSSYTALSEQHGNAESARQAVLLADFVHDLARHHGARMVRSLGDGALVHASTAEAGVRVALDAVARAESAGIWALHAGVNTGAMVRRGGDFYGASVNVAARIADEASPGEVMVTRSVVDAFDDDDVAFERIREATLKNVADPVELFRATAT